jgi:hypothetical protein
MLPTLLADMRTAARIRNAEAKVASATTAPAAVVEHAVFEGAVWMTYPPGWRIEPSTLWPLVADASVRDVVFALPDNKAVIVKASILRGAKRVLGQKPDLRSRVDDEGLPLRWGDAGGLDLLENREGIRPGCVIVPLANPSWTPTVSKAA